MTSDVGVATVEDVDSDFSLALETAMEEEIDEEETEGQLP